MWKLGGGWPRPVPSLLGEPLFKNIGFPLKLETFLKCALPTAVTALLFSPAFSKHRACDQGVLDHDFHTFHDVSECALAFAFAFVIQFDAE